MTLSLALFLCLPLSFRASPADGVACEMGNKMKKEQKVEIDKHSSVSIKVIFPVGSSVSGQ